MKLTIIGSVFLAGCAVAIPATHSLHEKRSANPHTLWKKSARVNKDAILPVRIGLTQTNLEDGYDLVMDVSDPESANFGKHWTPQQVHDKFAPNQDTVDAVKAWLIESGISADDIMHYENKGWLAFDAPTHQVERLFHTEYYEHEHERHGTLRVGCDEYHLPKHIQEHIDYVTPGVKFSAPMKKRSVEKRGFKGPVGGPLTSPYNWIPFSGFGPWPLAPGAKSLPTALQNCSTTVTPACIKALYNIPNATKSSPGNELGIYESYDTYAQSDLNAFFATFAPYVPQGTGPILNAIDGATAPVAANSAQNGGESDIDFDMAFSLIYPQKVILYQTDDLPQSTAEITGQLDGFLNTFLDALDGSYCNYTAYGITGNSPGIDATYPDPAPGGYQGQLQCGVYKPTRVISGSYGEAEADLPQNYQLRQCNEFMKLALQGHSILFSSGDYGVAGFPGDVSPSGCMGEKANIFTPDYPSNCPYITSVGGTQLAPNQTVYDPESALQTVLNGLNFSSSGGFANYFSPPDYQKAALATYFKLYNPPYPYYVGANNIGANGGIYNRAGRGFPDISANGAMYGAFLNGRRVKFYGTSLAAPLWASVLTLLNEERTAIGKGPVGFVNPTLYTFPWLLNDITNGTNPGCGTAGFKAVPGWDPVTGLGTPNFPRLLAFYLALP